MPGDGSAFASTQAAWRFYANPDVKAPALSAPLTQCGRAMASELDRFALLVLDWSRLTYPTHTRKADRIALNQFTLGYVVQTALLVSDRDGMALAPLAMSLWASDGIHTSRCSEVVEDRTHLEEATSTLEAIDALELGKPVVTIIDREGDSVAHLRAWDEAGRRVLVRATRQPKVLFEGEQMALGAVVERLTLRPGEAVDLSPHITGQQFLAETQVSVTRPAKPGRRHGERPKRAHLPGTPITLRLIVSQIRSPAEEVVAEWLLLTNVEQQVPCDQIAQWYVWRWRIESFFKLMKSSGQQVEQWQQESADAILKRLLVASMAAVVVWQVARAQGREAEATRALLTRLSGRQMRRERPWTEPAMLAGMWVLLAMLDALETYSVDDLRRIARSITMGIVRYDSS